VTIKGRNFGGPGEVVAKDAEFGIVSEESLGIVTWDPTTIVADAAGLAPGDWFLQIRPAGGESRRSVGRFILRVLPGTCEKPIGFWSVTCDRGTFISGVQFSLFADGTVFSGIPPSIVGAKIGEWAGSGRNVTITRCPPEPFRPSFEFQGEWSPDPETDFDFDACVTDDQCPGIRGRVTYYNSDGSLGFVADGCTNRVCTPEEQLMDPLRCAQFPVAGYNLFGPDQRDQRCHGGCWEFWETSWPHRCSGEISCGRRGAASCEVDTEGACPDGLVCRRLLEAGSAAPPCFCVPAVEEECTTSADCPADQTCTTEVALPWARDICLHDPGDPR
jgi:hypothetical protein